MKSGDESFFRLIALTGQAMRSYADKRLKSFDLTVEQLQLLKELTCEEGRSQSVLGEICSKSAANITRILDRLEKKKCIVRRQNPEDRRSSLVFLTAEGEKVCAEVSSSFAAQRAALVHGISGDQQQLAAHVLGAIKNNIETMSDKK